MCAIGNTFGRCERRGNKAPATRLIADTSFDVLGRISDRLGQTVSAERREMPHAQSEFQRTRYEAVIARNGECVACVGSTA